MPARRSDEDAVSPVIGVILMVAITVVLAAVVFVLMNRLNDDNAETAPELAMQRSPNGREVIVVRAEPGLEWSEDLLVSGTCTPTLNGAAFPAGPGTPVQAGDRLACASGEELRISSSEDLGNALLYDGLFP